MKPPSYRVQNQRRKLIKDGLQRHRAGLMPLPEHVAAVEAIQAEERYRATLRDIVHESLAPIIPSKG